MSRPVISHEEKSFCEREWATICRELGCPAQFIPRGEMLTASHVADINNIFQDLLNPGQQCVTQDNFTSAKGMSVKKGTQKWLTIKAVVDFDNSDSIELKEFFFYFIIQGLRNTSATHRTDDLESALRQSYTHFRSTVDNEIAEIKDFFA